MAVTYGFYNSLNKDRMYNAEQMSSIFNGIITDGVFSTIGDALMTVAGTGMQVIVKPGRAWFNSTWTLNDAQLPLDVPAADVSLTRIDAVILEVNSAVATRANSIKVLKGTPSANPAKPALSATETLHQYALAYITVGAGITSITAANIEINVGKTSCPFITSVLQQTDITDLFNQWDAEFTAWFENVQAQLSGNVAANLQRQIDALNGKIDDNWDKTLKSYTKQLLGIPESSTPDDAFMALLVGTTSKAYRVKVQYPDGTPAVGYTVSGIDALPTTTLVTDANGMCLGKSESTTPTISVAQKYEDVKAASVTVESVGTITDVTITLEYMEDVITVTSSFSKPSSISPKCTAIDYLLIGGGGGSGKTAMIGSMNTESGAAGGGGGGGGYYKKGTIMAPENGVTFAIAIGAPGAIGTDGKNGGATTISINGQLKGNANGGGGGKAGSAVDNDGSTVRTGTGGAGGVGNGNGGNGASFVMNLTYDRDGDVASVSGRLTQNATSGTNGETVDFHGRSIVTGGGGGGLGAKYNSNGYSSGDTYSQNGNSAASDYGRGTGAEGGTFGPNSSQGGGGTWQSLYDHCARLGGSGSAFYAYIH